MVKQQKAEVMLYSIELCPYCRSAKKLLDDLDIEYDETDLSSEPDRGAITSAILPGHTTVPLILVDGEPLGGYRDLEALHARGELEPKIFEE